MERITYQLPEELIAQFPLDKRDRCKLLHLDKSTGKLSEHLFSDIVKLLAKDDLLVMNDTMVQRTRLYGVGGQAGRRCEIFLVEKLSADEWICLVRPGKKAKVGDRFYFSAREYAQIAVVLPDGSRRVKFTGSSPEAMMEKYGHVPLPPYIKREDSPVDRKMYQTVYAKEGFSIAAPTAGMHFTEELLEQIEKMGVELCQLRLDIGRGTFKPIECKHYDKHKMDAEEYWISKDAAKQITKAMKKKRRIIAVGTSTMRALEGCFLKHQEIIATHDETDLFIYPGFEFKVVNAIITNFHLPESSLLALVAAFAGVEPILNAYQFAVANRYRFYSYGDAMLIA
jgi:S-adenosylmethionine:tRNA ribosyltransferase-isomerase